MASRVLALYVNNYPSSAKTLASSQTLRELCGKRCRRRKIMDLLTLKTPDPKFRLYWCLIEFIYWRYSQSCFDRVCEQLPLKLSLWLALSPFPPSLCEEVYCIHNFFPHTQCVRGNVWGYSNGGGVRQIKHQPQSPFTGPFF
jgi:hypothetical protein